MRTSNKKRRSKKQALSSIREEGKARNWFCALEESVRNLNGLILQTKTSYYENPGKKLNDPTLQSKTYWSILKGFYNGKRVPVIPPLLVNTNSRLISKSRKKNLIVFSANSAYL